MMLICLHLLLLSVVDGLPLAKIPMMDLHYLSTSPEDGLPLAKTFNNNLLNQIVSSKDDHKVLLNIVANADPAKLHEIIELIRVLLVASEHELEGLTTESGNADVAYNNAVNANNAAIVAQTNGLTQLKTDYDVAEAAAKTIYDQGVSSLQSVVDASNIAKDVASGAKNTANAVLSAERSRLQSEISNFEQVIALLEGVIGINTVAPTFAPTTEILPMFNFDAGNVGECPPGWTCSASFVMVEDCANQLCPNVDGLFFRVGNDGDVGWADSDVFRLPTNTKTLRFQRCGGADAGSGLYVILQSTESIVCSAENGANTDNFFTDDCDLSGYGGQNVHIKVVDAVNGGWGKTWLKDIEFLDGSGAILEA